MPNLNRRQQRFVEEYLKDLNATQAASRAGYSKKTAQQQGSRLLLNVVVQEALTKAIGQRSQRTEITADNVLQELAVLAFTDMGTYLTLGEDGKSHLDWSKLPDGATKAISEIQQETTTTIGKEEDDEIVTKTKFKLYDKRAALVDLGRHLKLFSDKVELEAGDALSEVLRLVAERPRPALPRDVIKPNGHAGNGHDSEAG